MNKKLFFLFILKAIPCLSIESSYKFLNNYEREFTLLSLGEKALEHGINIADNFINSSVVIISSQSHSFNTTNICQLDFTPTPESLNLMSTCEHFDVIFLSTTSINKTS